MPTDNTEARVASGMESLLSAIEAGDWERARDAVHFWEDELAERDEPVRFGEVLGSGVRDALDLARDADDRVDTCHVSIVWPGRGTTVRFRFDALGAGDEFSEIILAAVRRAVTGAAIKEDAPQPARIRGDR